MLERSGSGVEQTPHSKLWRLDWRLSKVFTAGVLWILIIDIGWPPLHWKIPGLILLLGALPFDYPSIVRLLTVSHGLHVSYPQHHIDDWRYITGIRFSPWAPVSFQIPIHP